MNSRRHIAPCVDRGFTLRELVVVVTIIVVVIVIAAVIASRIRGGENAIDPIERDAMHVRLIYESMVTFAGERDGHFPMPGRVRRHPVDIGMGPRFVPGRGEEDVTQNVTANLYAMIITQTYLDPSTVISPLERNPAVVEHEDYDWSEYDPSRNIYWDDSFRADLFRHSNASYAHLLLWGERRTHWRDTMSASYPLVGNRGPLNGNCSPGSFTCDERGEWAGHIAPGNGVARVTSNWEHLFRIDDGMDGGDAVLTFTLAIDEEDGPTIQHD